MKILTPPDFFSLIKGKHLLLDTSFFIELLAHETELKEFLISIKRHNIKITTIDPVRAEFMIGTNTEKILSKKIRHIEETIDYLLPINQDVINKKLTDMVIRYRQEGRGKSLVDVLLGVVLREYSSDLLLMTKNPKDFPRRFYSLKTYFLLNKENTVQVYAILSKNQSQPSQKQYHPV